MERKSVNIRHQIRVVGDTGKKKTAIFGAPKKRRTYGWTLIERLKLAVLNELYDLTIGIGQAHVRKEPIGQSIRR